MSSQSVLLAGKSEVISATAKIFKEKGQSVLVARNLEELNQIFSSEITISVMLLELQLEDVNGLNILENIRSGMFKAYQKMPIVVVAPEGTKQQYEQAKALKISGWLSKPLNHSTLNMIYEKFLLTIGEASPKIKLVDNMRYVFKKDLTEYLQDENDKKIKCFSSDISSSELMLVSFVSLTVDSMVKFILKEVIPLRVNWSKSIKPKVYYSNLRTIEKVNLVAKAYEAGLMNELKPVQVKKTRQEELVEQYNIKMEVMRKILVHLHSCDNSLISKVGLDKSPVPFDTYPIRYDEQSIIIAINADHSPLELAKCPDAVLLEKMQIFGVDKRLRGEKWLKIWPTENTKRAEPVKESVKEALLGENEFEVKIS